MQRRLGAAVGRHKSGRTRTVSASILALVLLWTVDAVANGRFPRAQRLIEAPSDPNRLVLAATYGLLVTSDRGATWHHVCEASFAHMAIFNGDPIVDFIRDESLIVGAQSSVSVSSDQGCNWLQTHGGGDDFLVDHAVSKSSPSTIVVAVFIPDPNSPTIVLRESIDNGRTWNPIGSPVPLSGLFTVDLDPLDPRHIYASGVLDGQGQLVVSTDHGSTWVAHPIPDTGSDEVPYIAGVHPTDPNRIFVRTDSSRQNGDANAGDSLLYSSDGGVSWRKILTSRAKLLGFALSPDGATVLAGYGDPTLGNPPGPVGVFVSATSDFSFEQVFGGHVNCLAWTKTGIYVCSDEWRDGFELGFSPSPDFRGDGSCIVPLLHRGEVKGPLACAATTTTGSLCEADWPTSCMKVGACSSDASVAPKECVPFMPQGDASAGDIGDVDAGVDGARAGDDASSEGGGPTDEAGCSCVVVGSRHANGPPFALGACACLAAFAQRRQEQRKKRRPVRQGETNTDARSGSGARNDHATRR